MRSETSRSPGEASLLGAICLVEPLPWAMNELLLECFRHSAWATKTIIATFRELAPSELERPAHGYGSLIATLDHFVRWDASYYTSLTGQQKSWQRTEEPTNDLDVLEARVDETAASWERLIAEGVDSERMLSLDGGAYRCRASVVVAQALHHAVAHREQIRGGLADIGVKVRDLQPWEYALATGRATWNPQSQP